MAASNRRKLIAGVAVAIVAIAGLAYGYVRNALREVEPFYSQAVDVEPEQHQANSREMERRVAALYSDAQAAGEWKSVFTDAEVNGWLATVLKDRYPDLLPPEVTEPRVAFEDGRCLLGYRYHSSSINTIVSIEAEGFMAEKDVAAVRFRKVRAGALPLPVSTVKEYIDDGAKKLEIPVRWTLQEGDPVVLIPVDNALSTPEERRRIELLEVRKGELLLSGATEAVTPTSDAAASAETVVESPDAS